MPWPGSKPGCGPKAVPCWQLRQTEDWSSPPWERPGRVCTPTALPGKRPPAKTGSATFWKCCCPTAARTGGPHGSNPWLFRSPGANPGVLGIGGGDRKNQRRDAQRNPGTGRVLGVFRLGVSPSGQNLQPAFHPGAGLFGRPLGAFEAIGAEVFPGLLCAANGLSYNGLLNPAGKHWGATPSPRARR